MIKIEDWDVIGLNYSPDMGLRLSGVVYGHPRKIDGTRVITSPVVLTYKRTVATKSGSLYKLGKPNDGYLQWLKHKGIVFDEEEPLKVKS